MRKLIFLIFLFIIISCAKNSQEEDLSINTDLNATIISGNNQRGYSFQELENNLVIKIVDKDSIPYCAAKFKFLINKSNGYVCSRYNRTSQNKGEYNFRWLLSSNLGNQNISIIALDSIDRIIDTIKFSATSQYSDTWNRSWGLPFDTCQFLFDRTANLIKHPDGRIFLHSHDRVEFYESLDQGFTWSKLSNLDYANHGVFINIDISWDGIFYLFSEKGLFKSENGKNWNKLIDFYISHYTIFDSGRIRVNTLFDGSFLSNDFGNTWIKDNSIPPYSKVIRISTNTFVAIDGENHAKLLISQNNGVTWEQLYGTSKFYDIVDFAYNDGFLFITHLEGINSIPVIYKSSVDEWNWTKLTTLIKNKGNYPSIAKMKFFKNNVYALTDTHIFKIDFSGDTTSLTSKIINKMPFISTFEISKQGILLIGSDYGGEFGKLGVFYRDLNVQ